MAAVETRTCTLCGAEKASTEFAKTGRGGHLRRQCKDCIYQRNRARDSATQEAIERKRERSRIAMRKQYREHPERFAARSAAKTERMRIARASLPSKSKQSPAERKAYRDAWRRKNQKRVNALAAAWRARNPEKAAEMEKRWAAAHPEAIRTRCANRRARLRGAPGRHTAAEWRKCVELAGSRCQHCGKAGTYRTLTRDHIVPLTRGGSNFIDNIQPLCYSCNSRKSNRLESELHYLVA